MLTLAAANLLQGLVALVWIAGSRRLAGPVEPEALVRWHAVALVLPPLLAAAGLAGFPPPDDRFRLARADLWAQAATGAGGALQGALALLLAGSTAIFVVQELAPAWIHRRRRLGGLVQPDARLEASLVRSLEAYRASGLRLGRGRAPWIRLLETDRRLAALRGVVQPVVLVSRGLLSELDDAELDGVVAHELAHLFRGGNLRELLLWIVRALQAPSPAALVLSRGLFQVAEEACDALAARVTGRPAALASALLKSTPRDAVPGPGSLARARSEVLRRAAVASTRLRVRALLDGKPAGRSPGPGAWAGAIALGAMLWAIA